jgi:aminoglycoside 6'-N-acetyltransferase I
MEKRMIVVPAQSSHLRQWAQMRIRLWVWDTVEDHAEEAEELYLSAHPDRAAFVALNGNGSLSGFAEATIRRDYVEGCDTSPVVFLEGIYVRPDMRKRGIARALSDAVAGWGRTCGASEYASNALLENTDSHAFHAAIGFAETERVVFFKQALGPTSLNAE